MSRRSSVSFGRAGRSAVMRVVVLGAVLLAGALQGLTLHAQERELPGATVPRKVSRPKGVPTRMGQELVLHSDIIGVFEVLSVRSAGVGAVLVRCKVLEPIHAAPGRQLKVDGEVVLLTYQGHVVEQSRELMFLQSVAGGVRYQLLYRVPSQEQGFGPKALAARRTVALARIKDARRRAHQTVDWLLELLAAEPRSSGDWWARYALDELDWMTREQPWVFRPGDGVRVRRAGERWRTSELVADVENVSSAAREAARRLFESPESGTSPR